MKTDSSVKILLLLIFIALVYICYVITNVSGMLHNINSTLDSTAVGGSGNNPHGPRKTTAFKVQIQDTTTDTTGNGGSGNPKK